MIVSAALLMLPLLQDSVPTVEHAAHVAKLIEETKKSGDFAKFDRACDLDAYAARVLGKADLSGPMRRLLLSLIRGDERVGPFNVLRSPVEIGSTAALLRIRTVEGAPRPLFRTVDAQGNHGYVEWVISASKDGPRLVDAFLFTTGELVSASMTRYLVPHHDSLRVLNSLKGPTVGDLMHSNEDLFDLLHLQQQGKLKEVLERFDQKRGALRRNKTAHLVRLNAAAQAVPDTYAKAFSDFESQFPGDAALTCLRIPGRRAAGKFDEALEAVDVLDKEVGGDPYLDAVRSALHAEAGRLDMAAEAGKKCTDAEPSLAEGWYARLAVPLRNKDVGGAVKLLEEGGKSAKLLAARIEALPGAEVIKESEDYRTWRSKQ